MKILADQCLPGKTVNLLRVQGHKVITLSELDKTTAADEAVLQIAKEQNAVLVTVDLDFANILIYPPRDYHGIIVLRMSARSEERINLLLSRYLLWAGAKTLKHKLVIIDSGGIRIHPDYPNK